MFIYKLLVIQSHYMQNSCMKIVDVYRIFYNVITKLICFSITNIKNMRSLLLKIIHRHVMRVHIQVFIIPEWKI